MRYQSIYLFKIALANKLRLVLKCPKINSRSINDFRSYNCPYINTEISFTQQFDASDKSDLTNQKVEVKS